MVEDPLAGLSRQAGTVCRIGAKRLQDDFERFVVASLFAGFAHDTRGNPAFHDDRNDPPRHGVDQDRGPAFRSVRGGIGGQDQDLELCPQGRDFILGHAAEPPNPGRQTEPLGQKLEILLFGAGARHGEIPPAQQGRTGPEEAIDASIGKQPADVPETEHLARRSLRRRRERYSELGQLDHRDSGQELAKVFDGERIPCDNPASRPKRAADPTPREESIGPASVLAAEYHRYLESGRFDRSKDRDGRPRLFLDLDQVGPAIGEERTNGLAIPRAGWIGRVSLRRDGCQTDAGIFGGGATGDRRGERDTHPGQRAELAAAVGIEVEMREDDGPHWQGNYYLLVQ